MFRGWNKKYLYLGGTAIIVLVVWQVLNITLLSWDHVMGMVGMINTALSPVYIGLIIAYLLDPLMGILEAHVMDPLAHRILKKKVHLADGIARGVSVFVVILAAIFALFGLFMLVLPELVNSLTSLVNNMPSYYQVLREWIQGLGKSHPEIAQYTMNLSESAYQQLRTWLENDLLPSSTQILASVSGSVMGFLSTLFDIFIGLIISIYLLANKEVFLAQSRKLIYSIFPVNRANNLLELCGEANYIFSKFISGKLIDSVIVGIITFFVMSILGMPYASLISVIIGVTNVIPFFGQYIGIIPSAFLVLLVSPVQCLIFLIVIIIIMQVDGNIIGPKIIGETTGLGSFWILFSILVFGSLFGLIGMLVAVPVFALIYRSTKKWSASRLKKKKLPVDTEFYLNHKSIQIKEKKD